MVELRASVVMLLLTGAALAIVAVATASLWAAVLAIGAVGLAGRVVASRRAGLSRRRHR